MSIEQWFISKGFYTRNNPPPRFTRWNKPLFRWRIWRLVIRASFGWDHPAFFKFYTYSSAGRFWACARITLGDYQPSLGLVFDYGGSWKRIYAIQT